MAYLNKLFHGRVAGTPQGVAQPGKDQVKNSAAGYVYALDESAYADRIKAFRLK